LKSTLHENTSAREATGIMTTKTVIIADPLAPYTQLSTGIYLYEPLTKTIDDIDGKSHHGPTIVIAFWFSAAPRTLVKFVAEYAKLAPSARIIFLLSAPADFYLYFTWASHRRRLMPAIEAIRAADGPVMMHIFSNGGVFTTAHLLLGYRHVTGGQVMPVTSLIVDSAPGRATPARSVKALAYALPKSPFVLRQLGFGALWVTVLIGWVVRKITSAGGKDEFAFAREALLDHALITSHSSSGGDAKVKRCYVYSGSDDLVSADDVEEHVAEAVAKGWSVEKERFDGTPHVGHMRADPVRYWGIVSRYLQVQGT
jgi:hypothetical protein